MSAINLRGAIPPPSASAPTPVISRAIDIGQQALQSRSAHLSKVVYHLPLSPIKGLYANATTKEQKQACICYLLYYQHYNAEFIESESRNLGYPTPLCAVQTNSGYIRTEFNRLLELIWPWFNRHLSPFLERSYTNPPKYDPLNSREEKETVKLSSSTALDVLRTFFPKEMEQIKLIRLKTKDLLEKTASEILKKEILTLNKSSEDHFLFLLEAENVDCTVLWGGKWAAPKKNTTLRWLSLDKMFKGGVFSILNKAGAIPDRLSINDLLVQDIIENGDFLDTLYKISLSELIKKEKNSPHLPREVIHWAKQMENINNYTFENDPGTRLYRDAILRWHSEFFATDKLVELASPLLCSQVNPWMVKNGGIVQWAKAYQNLCEIVMFCLHYSPEICQELNLKDSLLKPIDHRGLYSSVELFSYGMGAFFHAFHQIFTRSNKQMKIALICQNYFEILRLLSEMPNSAHIISKEFDRINQIDETPDILVADIHPNNAGRKILFQNDVGFWIKDRLDRDPSKTMILILDFTLNTLSDKVIQETIKTLKSFVTEGRLEIFGIQSLAKLFQLGSDNFSGGVCVYLGKSNTPAQETQKSQQRELAIKRKEAFFTLLNSNFHDLIDRYFKQIRENTEWMYRILNERFSMISETIWRDEEESDSSYKVAFCATKVIPNGDENTVYVVISFEPFLEVVKIEKEKQEVLINEFRKLILHLAAQRNLPLTGRQSFGFSLSNMTGVSDSIRFSIGVESRTLLEQYADFISDFSYALSIFVVKSPRRFIWEDFKQDIEDVFAILDGSKSLSPTIMPLYEIDDFLDSCNKIGDAEICFSKGLLALKVSENTEESLPHIITVSQMEIRKKMNDRSSFFNDSAWSPSDLMKLLIHVLCLDCDSLFVEKQIIGGNPAFAIAGIFEHPFPFNLGGDNVIDTSGISIVFEPEFSLTLPDKTTYKNDKVFVRIDNCGTVPIRLSKLDDLQRREVFTKCVRHALKAEPYGNESNAILLEFKDRKSHLNYEEEIRTYFSKGGLKDVVKFLNGLDFKNLPLSHDHSWRQSYQMISDHPLNKAMKLLGAHIIFKLTNEMVSDWNEICDKRCKEAVLEGIWDGLCANSFDDYSLEKESARIIAGMFSSMNGTGIVDGYEFDEWILSIEEHIRKNPSDKQKLVSYLIALFPVIKKIYASPGALCDTTHSVPLRSVGEQTGFQDLQEHMSCLESKVPECAKKTKKEESLVSYLELYVRYPLPPPIKSRLLEALKAIPENIRYSWLNSPGFYYASLLALDDPLGFEATDRDLILRKEDQKASQVFFEGVGCKAILLRYLEREDSKIVDTAFWWAITTQDDELFSKLSEIYRKLPLHPDLLEILEKYETHLERPFLGQASLSVKPAKPERSSYTCC